MILAPKYDIFLGKFNGGSYFLHKTSEFECFNYIIRFINDRNIGGHLHFDHILEKQKPYWTLEIYDFKHYLHQYKLAYQIAQRYLLLI